VGTAALVHGLIHAVMEIDTLPFYPKTLLATKIEMLVGGFLVGLTLSKVYNKFHKSE